MTSKARELQRRQNEHRVALFEAHRGEEFERERVALEFVQQRRIEGKSFVVLGGECEVIALARVVKIGGFHGRGLILG